MRESFVQHIRHPRYQEKESDEQLYAFVYSEGIFVPIKVSGYRVDRNLPAIDLLGKIGGNSLRIIRVKKESKE